MPGRGMEVLSITANFPGKGNVDVLYTHDPAAAENMLDHQDTPNGDLGYRLGAAFLFPYPNRIRGTLSADGKTLSTSWQGQQITLPPTTSSRPVSVYPPLAGLICKRQTTPRWARTFTMTTGAS